MAQPADWAIETPLDPIRFEVVRNALTSATEEMAATIRRSAYSTNIKTRADFSCCFLDASLRVIAQAAGQPAHLGNLARLVPNAVAAYGLEINPGDVLLVNDPYLGNLHLNDVTVIAPVHDGATLLGYLANLAHHVDVGGGAPASIAVSREIYQEGVQIPPVKLVDRGVVVDDIFRLVLAQIRSKRETSGDLRAQIAALAIGARRVLELVEAIGQADFRTYVDEIVAYTARRTRRAVTGLPSGRFEAAGELDSDGVGGGPVLLRVAVDIHDGAVTFDFSGSDAQREAPVNATLAPIFSACAYALKTLIDPDIPVNAGFYESVHVEAPVGSVVNATAPAPTVGGGEVYIRVTDLIYLALSQVMPERVPAGTKAMICHAGFGGIDPRNGDYYCVLETVAGGYGGRAERDGPDAVQPHGQNTENAPIEETEAAYPVRIVRYELIPNSEGPGRMRGGLGLRRDYAFPGHSTTFTLLADRERNGPWGLFGGRPGSKASYILDPDTDPVELESKATHRLRPGAVVSYQTCGGGGYGPPFERQLELVLADVRDGKVSKNRAASEYGVALTDDSEAIDFVATALLRGAGAPR